MTVSQTERGRSMVARGTETGRSPTVGAKRAATRGGQRTRRPRDPAREPVVRTVGAAWISGERCCLPRYRFSGAARGLGGGKTADPDGAMKSIGSQPFGGVM